MSYLKRKFKEVLSSECLTVQERRHLKKQFKQFLDKREIISRKIVKEVYLEIEENDYDIKIHG